MYSVESLGSLNLLNLGFPHQAEEKLEIEDEVIGLVEEATGFQQVAAEEYSRLWDRVNICPVSWDQLQGLHLAIVEACFVRAMISQEKSVILIDVQGIGIDHVEVGIFREALGHFPQSIMGQ